MAFIGRIANGTIVLPPDVHLPEGTEVRVEPIAPTAAKSRRERAAALRQLATTTRELPADLAKNHDHCLYGTPLR